MKAKLGVSPFKYRSSLRMMLEARLRLVVVCEAISIEEHTIQSPEIDLARAVGVSRKALQRWVERYRAAGGNELDQLNALHPRAGEKWISRPVEMVVLRSTKKPR